MGTTYYLFLETFLEIKKIETHLQTIDIIHSSRGNIPSFLTGKYILKFIHHQNSLAIIYLKTLGNCNEF